MSEQSFWENKVAVSVLKHVIGLILVAVIYFTTWPTKEEPILWTPSENPGLTGVYAPNEKLAAGTYLNGEQGVGPEGVAVAPDGMLWTGFHDGRILRFDPTGKKAPEFITNTQGRPLGLQFDDKGDLIVADAFKGLIKVGMNGAVTPLSTEVNGKPIIFADDLDIKSDGTIWFSDASTRFIYKQDISELLENNPTGRLLIYDPKTGKSEIKLDGLSFANGVAFGPDEEFVLINETHRNRIRRLWLKGPKAGQDDMFMDGLPGYPDNITFNGKDTFWVTFPSPRDDNVDALAEQPDLRKVLSRLPHALFPLPAPLGFVIGIDVEGNVTHNFQDSSGTYANMTSAIEHEGALYMGSLSNMSIVKLELE